MRAQPKGRVLQRNLDTHYVRFDGILQSLRHEAFSGYVRCVLETDEGLIFFRDGDLVAAVFETGGTLTRGLPALEAIAANLRSARAFLDLCRLDHDLLNALLAVWHGQTLVLEPGEFPASPAALADLARGRQVTGALACETPAGPMVTYIADGEVLGWHAVDADTWQPPAATWPTGATGWRIHHAAQAATLRTIDLNRQKDQVMDQLAGAMRRHVPSFGSRLFAVECHAGGMTDPHRLTKADFGRLATALADRARLLIGEQRAGTLSAALTESMADLIDLGI